MARATRPSFAERLTDFWFNRGSPKFGPLVRTGLHFAELVYRVLLALRVIWIQFRPPKKAPGCRVLAVGNLVVGGAGKTPCALALANALNTRQIPFGIIARGYRSRAEQETARLVTPAELTSLTPADIGDEAWLLCWRTQRPVVVGKDRFAAITLLRKAHPEIQVAILDDGLQQRSLAWTDSLVLIDRRGLGNEHCLPAGPLREPTHRLRRFDHWIDNAAPQEVTDRLPLPPSQGRLEQTNACWVPIDQWQKPAQWIDFEKGLQQAKRRSILAVAGIATPEQFFQILRQQDLIIDTLALPDHATDLVAQTLRQCEEKHYDLILMTEKDAVKFFHVRSPIHNHAWALRREATLDPDFIKRLFDGPKTA
jgi:tetraacyldisaccharide 4'-kinase